MYRIYRTILGSFQGDFEFFMKKWYILDKIFTILQLISWILPDDEGGITCMKPKISEIPDFSCYVVMPSYIFKYQNLSVCCLEIFYN